MPINGIETAYKNRYTFAPLSQRAVPIQWYTLPLRFIRLRASPLVLIGLWRKEFRVSHFQGLRQRERLHVHELAGVHQLSELAELDLNHRNVLVLGRNSATLRNAIRAPIRREIKNDSLG